MENLFHLSLPCHNLIETKKFYVDILGADFGRSANNWVDINLFGHQITFTQVGKFDFTNPNYIFEGKLLSSFHFGIILDIDSWSKIYSNLSKENFELTTQATFLRNKPGEHLSFFIKDPSGYMLEFKSFRDINEIFES